MILDPGHGGLDGGASAADGTTESALNLSIALRAAQLARLFGLPVLLTRESETLQYPDDSATIHAKKVWDQKQRVSLIRSTSNAVLISIHQNFYPDSRPHGAQVLYAAGEGSRMLGELSQHQLVTLLDPVAAPISDRIYLMREIDCPAILVECGFLSNPEEAARLQDPKHQNKLALALLSSYLEYLKI